MQTPVSRVAVSFGCSGVPKMDLKSESDPFVVVEMNSRATNNVWREVHRTKAARDTQQAQFPEHWVTEYYFEETQQLRISLYDEDNPRSRKLEDHDFIGYAETTLGRIVSSGSVSWFDVANASPSAALKKKTKGGKALGRVAAQAEELSQSQDATITFRFVGEGLDKKDVFGKSDPYLQIFRAAQDGSWQLVHQTETLRKTLNPQWKPFVIRMSALNNGERERPLKFSVWDWDKTGGHDHIGDAVLQNGFVELETQFASGGFQCSLINPKLQKKKKRYTDSGRLVLSGLIVQPEHSFVEFLQGGLQINLMFGIDFTGSNGVPSSSDSLHYMGGQGPNQYQQAIYNVGNVVVPYDSDQMLPVYGFGGKINGRADFCFPLTMQDNPEVFGIQGVLDVYAHAINQVPLYGPTNFAPLIQQAIVIARANEGSYLILLLITDGEICDMPETIEAIIEASSYPISIIICGVGKANFKSMETLDADDEPLRGPRSGRTAEADIVQFVEFGKFPQGGEALARETLHEVPAQVVSFFKRHNIQPNPPVQRQFAEDV